MMPQREMFMLGPGLDEQSLWTEFALPRLSGLKPNVLQVCEYGFTEMVNNVIDHSQSSSVTLGANIDDNRVKLTVADLGVGIFRNIREKLRLPDDHSAMLELAKGGVTTDPDRHTGEGIFFTARMFDEFILSSRGIAFFFRSGSQDWVHEQPDSIVEGTSVSMEIGRDSDRTPREVFDRFVSGEGAFRFDTTVLVVRMFGGESQHLVSRSQAKRLLTRLEGFGTILIDFDGIADIGPAFADEIFRVFARIHPSVSLIPINANEQVTRAILRAKARDGNGGES